MSLLQREDVSSMEPQRQRRPKNQSSGQSQADDTRQTVEGATDSAMKHCSSLPMNDFEPAYATQSHAPRTPSRRRSSRNKAPLQQHPGGEPHKESTHTHKKKRTKSRKPDASPARPDTSATPAIMGTSTATSTPRPVSQTPADFYAGPTFHNSPAPSSLPVPKLFRKSSPNVSVVDAVTFGPDGQSSDASSSIDENSPMQRKAILVQEQQRREESPLDVFFQADKQEKVVRTPPAFSTDLSNRSSPFFRSEHTVRSPSPSTGAPSQRQQPDAPPTALKSGSQISTDPHDHDSPTLPVPFLGDNGAASARSAPSDVFPSGMTDEDIIQMKKSEQLKKLLMSHILPQRPPGSPVSEAYGSVPIDSSPFRGHAGSTAMPTARPKSAGLSPTTIRSKQARDHTHSPSRPARGSRPASSNLRNEITQKTTSESISPSEGLAAPPSRPILRQQQQLQHHQRPSSLSENDRQSLLHNPPRPLVSAQSSNFDYDTVRPYSQGALGGSGHGLDSPTKSMEDQLRSILKVESSGDRILDVRS